METKDGPIILGQYEFLSKIKQGGMGAIYLARHHRLNDRLVVIKTMRPELAEREEYQKRFWREASNTSPLDHLNIARLIDFDETEGGTLYMVLEFIDGINLKDLIAACGPPPVALTVEIVKQALAALGYLHKAGKVHRDISPDNLMLTADQGGGPVVKLIDLGIAKTVEGSETITEHGSFVGKLQYCSPEQLKLGAGSAGIDARSDLFSLGIVLAELLTGMRVFPSSAPAVLLGTRTKPVPLDFERDDPRGRIGSLLRSVVMRSVEMDPNLRFQTAEEFSAALTEALASLGRTRENFGSYLQRARDARPSHSFTALSDADRTIVEGLFRRGTQTGPTLGIGVEGGRTILEPSLPPPVPPPVPPLVPPKPRLPRWPAWLAACVVLLLVIGSLLWRVRPQPAVPSQPAQTEVRAPTPVPEPSLGAPATVPSIPVPPEVVPGPGQTRPHEKPGEKAGGVFAQTPPSGSPTDRQSPPTAGSPLCFVQPGSTYSQLVLKEQAKGFEKDASPQFVAPRTDSARVTVKFRCEPAAPREGEAFRLEARLKNDGDLTVDIVKIEELGASGWRLIQEFPKKQTVDVAAAFTVYRYEGSVAPGKRLEKTIRVVEDEGSAWTAQVRVSACD